MLTYMATMNGADRDLTPYVFEATWKHGSKQENYFGQLADPAEGNLTLWNQGGEFITYNPAPWVDPTPGPAVWIEHSGTRLFTGHSAFIPNQTPTSSAQDTASMPLLGPLAFLDRFSSRLFSTLDGDQRSSQVWDLILDAAGFSGIKLTQVGRTILSAIRVNQASLLGSARERIDFLQALRTVVQAEVGRGYDDRRGRAVFRNREARSAFWATTTAFVLDSSNVRIESAQIPNVIDSIINVIEAPFDEFTAQGSQAIEFRSISPPHTYTIPSGGATLILFVDDSSFTSHVRDWVELERGVDYTYTLPTITPVLDFDPLNPAIVVPNPTGLSQTFTLEQVRGNPQRVSSQQRLNVQSARSVMPPPVGYGPRPIIYPADLLNDAEEIADHLEWCVRLHDGIGANGQKDINEIRAVQIHVNLRRPENIGLIGIDIDDLCFVTEPRLGLSGAPFWVDSAEYHATAAPQTFDLTLELSDARATMMWPIDGMQFGDAGEFTNTRVGF